MNTMLDILQAILPGILVFLTAWLLLDKYLGNLPINQNPSKNTSTTENLDVEKLKILLPLKLKAFERLIIFLERINPPSLIMRQNQMGMSALQLQIELLKTIREEYEHNQSLQIYVSKETWAAISHAKDEVAGLVKLSSGKLNNLESSSRELSKIILEIDGQVNDNPVRKAIRALNEEANREM